MASLSPHIYSASSSGFSARSSSSSSSVTSSSNNSVSYRRGEIPEGAVAFLDGPDRQAMENAASRCGNVVCQVLTDKPDKRGTGCLIGTVLLLTNHHVLPDLETARNSHAFFFRVVSRSRSGPQQTDRIETIKVELDPDTFFETSPNRIIHGQPQPAEKDFLDFTVVALKPAPYLSTTRDLVFSIFSASKPVKDVPICVIQHPEVFSPGSGLQGDLKWSYGQVVDITEYTVSYNAPTHGGSSGGAVIDSQGQLIALHYQARSDGTKTGILIHQIAAALATRKEEMERINSIPLPLDLSGKKVIGLPQANELFTGREEELTQLERACSEGKRVAIVGLGGVGKTTLVVKYANDHQDDYALIGFIQAGTTSQIETGLSDLAKALNITEDSIEKRLKSLRSHLETSQEGILLIFDGVDDEETLRYLEALLPSRGCTTLLVSSRLEHPLIRASSSQISLQDFEESEAVNFLLRGAEGKDTNREEAAELAKKLFFFPLALQHAAAYIRSTRGSSFKLYRERLQKYGLSLFDPKYNRNEQTILTTWKKSIDAIKEIHQCPLAEDILQLASICGDAPIPLELLRKQFSDDELEFDLAITQLGNYSLVKTSEQNVALHSLLHQVISHQMSKGQKERLLLDAVELLYDCCKDLDLSRSSKEWGLDSLIPHINAVLEESKSSNSIDTLKVGLLSKISAAKYAFNKLVSGALLHKIYQYEEAFKQAQDALEVSRSTLGKQHPDTAQSDDSVSLTLNQLRRYEEALQHAKKVLEIFRECLGEQQLDTGLSYRNIGDTLSESRRHEEALQHKQKAFELHKLRRYEEALQDAQKVLDIHKEILGENLPDTARIDDSVGVTLNQLRKYEEALKHAQKAIDIRREILGENLPDRALHLGVGFILHLLCRHEEALPHAQKALEILQSTFEEHHSDTTTAIRLLESVETLALRLSLTGTTSPTSSSSDPVVLPSPASSPTPLLPAPVQEASNELTSNTLAPEPST